MWERVTQVMLSNLGHKHFLSDCDEDGEEEQTVDGGNEKEHWIVVKHDSK